MSLQLSLLRWSSKGLRCPNHTVSLRQDNGADPYSVTLIQMPNGTGKTTTLNMLRATLSGSAKNWNREKILSFKSSDSSISSGQFVVRLALSGSPLTYELNLDFENCLVSYRTTFGSGIKDGFYPPANLKKFFNAEFVKLFVFDGELASNLMDAKQTRAKEAIDALFQLSLLEELEGKFQENWERRASTVGAKEKQGLTLRQNRLKKLVKQRDYIKLRREELHKKKSGLDEDIQRTQKKYDELLVKDKNTGKQLKDLQENLKQSEKNVEKELNQAISKMRDPQSLIPGLADSLMNLKENLDCLKLPTSTSKEFFEDLAKAEECVCGRQMDDLTRQAVRDRANHYLGEDEVGILNSIKSDIATYCSGDPDLNERELKESLKNLGSRIQKRDTLQTKYSSVEQDRIQQGDNELEEIKNKLNRCKDDREGIKKDLNEIERSPRVNPKETTQCLKELDILIKRAEEDVAEITNTLNLKYKTEIVRNILSEACEQAREALRKYMVDKTNKRIAELLTRDPVFLEDIQDSLQLRGKAGASVGQTLSVSYAFLATLFDRSDYQLPFIVDSPAGPLDLNVRPQVARLVPKLCKQFVAFTISSERQSFVNVLHKASNQKVQYITLFRKTAQMSELWKNIAPSLIQEESDGVLIKGKEFFDRFDLDEEI
ncbi:hypothetical protein [Lusitaniella coriacea]|uniref:hypothetical protein n=1 Tax=Lusitaniella coriacea TaxID=1983105 RepID=UPI003CE910FF